jgi:hypothetical protein
MNVWIRMYLHAHTRTITHTKKQANLRFVGLVMLADSGLTLLFIEGHTAFVSEALYLYITNKNL